MSSKKGTKKEKPEPEAIEGDAEESNNSAETETSPKTERKKNQTPPKTTPKPIPDEKTPEHPPKPILTGTFVASFRDSKSICLIFEAVASIVSDCNLIVNKDGISITAMDGSHICLIALSINKMDMDTFSPPNEPLTIGINLADLVKILKRKGSNDAITFTLQSEQRRLNIDFKPENTKKSRRFNIAMIDVEGETVNMEGLNKIQYKSVFLIAIDLMSEAIKDAEIFSEVLVLTVKPNKLIFSTDGMIGDMSYELEKEELTEVVSLEPTNTETAYALGFMREVAKIGNVSNIFKIFFSQETPLRLESKLFEHSNVIYALAPRVSEDTDTSDKEDE